MLPLLALTLLLSSGATAAGQGADPPETLAALVKSQLRRLQDRGQPPLRRSKRVNSAFATGLNYTF